MTVPVSTILLLGLGVRRTIRAEEMTTPSSHFGRILGRNDEIITLTLIGSSQVCSTCFTLEGLQKKKNQTMEKPSKPVDIITKPECSPAIENILTSGLSSLST